ncbi:Eco57I restriction-modification methylase domain-containing protein [Natranaeroarchaeum sulfidigenes]|nr:N-6 DNA methylase [Natranaeroarchaeum sulfidigenes]
MHDALVERLETAADAVTGAIDTGVPESLREAITEWCALHGVDDPPAEHTQTIIARQAVLNVLLKATLYEWHHQYDDLPQLATDTRAALRRAAEQTGNPAFDEYFLDEIVWLADDADLEPVLDARDWLLDSGEPAEAIGRLYADLMSTDDRQMLGQFRTPPSISSLMRTWAASGDDNVLDPGMGAGVLSGPFHPLWDVSTEPSHVNGIDRSRLSRLMGTTALTLYRQAHDTQVTDFLELSVDDLDRDVDAIVCNPPYVKGDVLEDTYKNRVNTQMERITGLDISARSPLYTYFMYHARSFLAPGDCAAFLTPDSFMATDYGESLKQFLLDEFSITAFVQFDTEGDSVFEDAQVTALLSFIEAKTTDTAGGMTRFIRVDKSIEASTLRHALRNGEQGETEWGYINHVQQGELAPENNWTARLAPSDIDTSGLTPLGEFVSIDRGKSTGDVEVFCLSQSDVDAYGIPDQDLSRLIRRPQVTEGYDICESDWEELRASEKEAWLLDPDELPTVPESDLAFKRQVENGTVAVPNDEADRANTVAYLQNAITERDLAGTTVLQNRPYWYRPRRQSSPRVLVPDADRDGFAFLLNETTARHIHNFRGFYDVAVSETELKALLAYLNSPIGQRVIQTQTQPQQGGYEKLSISALESLPVIDPTSLDNSTVAALADLFDELRENARKDRNCEVVLNRLDGLLQRVM